MPNPLYEWQATNDTVATVDATGLVTAKNLGKTFVSVHYVST